jgi:hypothetical protein
MGHSILFLRLVIFIKILPAKSPTRGRPAPKTLLFGTLNHEAPILVIAEQLRQTELSKQRLQTATSNRDFKPRLQKTLLFRQPIKVTQRRHSISLVFFEDCRFKVKLGQAKTAS